MTRGAKIKNSPRREPRPLALWLTVLNTGMISQVSTSDPRNRARYLSLCLFPSDENAGDTREEESEPEVPRGTCRSHCVVRSLLTSPVSGTNCGDTALEAPVILADVPEDADGFGPLKTALGAISTAYPKHEVRLRPSPQDSS
jgi:hypothetical protein